MDKASTTTNVSPVISANFSHFSRMIYNLILRSSGISVIGTQLNCKVCGTGVVGKFELSPIFRLSPESLKCLEAFVRIRGNVKEMERATGESYWEIRRLDADGLVELRSHNITKRFIREMRQAYGDDLTIS